MNHDRPEAVEAQAAAIAASGWGQRFHLVQPHNACFWVYLLGVGAGLVGMIGIFGPATGFYRPALTSGVVLFGIYLVPWLLLLRHHNRFTSLPGGLLATAFVWGAVAATFWIAVPANTALLTVWTKLGGTAFADDWAAGLTAPINEEWGKALGLVLALGLAPSIVRSPYDGFVVGAYIGLGFEVVEDVLYVVQGAQQSFGAGQVGSSLATFAARGASGIASHALFSAIFCAGLMWVLTRVPGQRRVVPGLAAMVMAMVFHFAWDDMAGLGGGSTVLLVLLPVVIVVIELVALFAVLRHASVGERAWIRDILAPEVARGTIDEPLLDAVSGLRRDRKRYRRHAGSRLRGRHQIAGAQDLAKALAEGGGADTHDVEHARAELARLGAPARRR